MIGLEGDTVKRIKNGGAGAFTLHHRLEEAHREPYMLLIAVELVEEIAVTGRGWRRYDGDTRGHVGPLQLTVQIDDTFARQPVDNLLAAPHKVTHGVVRVDI